MSKTPPAPRRKPGPPKKPEDQVLRPYSVGFTDAQRAKIDRIGSWEALRKMVDAIPEPKP